MRNIFDIDPVLLECKRIPAAFAESVYVASELIDMLKTTENEFWIALQAGRIPSAVFLPGTDAPPVWDRGVIDHWMAEGCPVDPRVAGHHLVVFKTLIDALKDELGHNPPTDVERN